MPITASQLRSFLKDVKEEKAKNNAPPPPEAPGALHFGPLEQAIMVLIIVGMVSDPATTGIPSVLTPGMTMLLIVAYIGYRLMEHQKEAEKRAREEPPKPTSKSSSASSSAREKEEKEKEKVKSSGTQVTTKEDLLKDQTRLKEKAASTSKEVRAATKKTQYFLTMNGKGRMGFEEVTAKRAPDGTLWWNNVPNLKGEKHLSLSLGVALVQSTVPNLYIVDDMMVPSAAPAKSSREERKEKEASKHVQPPGTISAEEIAARLPLEREMEAEKEKERFQARNIAALPPGTKNPYEEKLDYGGTGADI
ncbi:hypothetical protein QFC19_006243 [Naganishia cerealis]|uniref:Uncharacterized protein n=2 Tax=Naganishia TaxID=1851509 RepID=A0ACC2VHN7_9TREE|nr:hypothetical protein QFC19_006243 [Naganishia cerealis]